MVPEALWPLFWDVRIEDFRPTEWPFYTILRVLEFGDHGAVEWMRSVFSREQIEEVLRTERRLSRRSAGFWSLVYDVPRDEIASLRN